MKRLSEQQKEAIVAFVKENAQKKSPFVADKQNFRLQGNVESCPLFVSEVIQMPAADGIIVVCTPEMGGISIEKAIQGNAGRRHYVWVVMCDATAWVELLDPREGGGLKFSGHRMKYPPGPPLSPVHPWTAPISPVKD
jgi:hypothetical protein